MPKSIGGQTYYQIHEVAEMLGVSRQTLHRWFHQRRVPDVARDRRGWRIFSLADVERLRRLVEAIRAPEAVTK